MRVLVDTGVVADLFVNRNKNDKCRWLYRHLTENREIKSWVTALSVIEAEMLMTESRKEPEQGALSDFVKDNFPIIPLRKQSFLLADYDKTCRYEKKVQISCAASMNIDFILTTDIDAYGETTFPVKSVDAFLGQIESSKMSDVNHVPFLDLKAQQHLIYNEIDDHFADIVANTAFILGKHVETFERRFAEAHDVKHCIGVSNGTAALHIALMALGIGPGDHVIVPVNTFIATAEAVSMVGATPVFIDCNEHYNMDIERLNDYLKECRKEGQEYPKAIIPVHLYGQPGNMDRIVSVAEAYGIAIVEDSCQAHLAEWQGKKIGGFGKFSAFSFYPGKNLGAYGEAGALITNDDMLCSVAKKIRQHGEVKRYHHELVGHNFRMEAFQGAVLTAKLKHLETWTEMRRINAAIYNDALEGVSGVETPKLLQGAKSVYHLYVIQVDKRDSLQAFLKEKGIDTGLHYPVPLHLQSAYRHLNYELGDFPVAERASKRILSLPMYPELEERQIKYVCDSIKRFLK